MTIQEAWKRILEIRGERTTCMTVEFWHHNSHPGKTSVKVWLFDGKMSQEVPSLEALIGLAEGSVSEPPVIDGELPEATEKKEGQADG